MRRMMLSPEAKGYSATPAPGAIQAALDGGVSHFRAAPRGGATRLQLRWVLEDVEYQYVRAFWRTGTRNGAEPFLIDLNLRGVLERFLGKFLPGTMSLQSVRGRLYEVTAAVEVRPQPYEEA